MDIPRRILPVATSTLMSSISIGILQPILPLLARSLEITTAEYGLIVAAGGFTRTLFAAPTSMLADAIGKFFFGTFPVNPLLRDMFRPKTPAGRGYPW